MKKSRKFIPKKMILTAGPIPSKKELQYTRDAVMNGWNFHHSDYLRKFEEAFAAYIGTKYALCVADGTAALHLALHLMGVGPGDEVIIPDMTVVACSFAVQYCGATPVFADIDQETWTIDAEKLEKYITKKTKAIMPVHLYGNIADLAAIRKIAKKHNLFILEDACEGLGCELNGKKIGSFGDAAAFSFQGAKLVAIGQGGMITMNRKDWYDRAQSLIYCGQDFSRQFWTKEFGFMYLMSNIQAALGLARFEEIDRFIAIKRKIAGWYRKRLEGIDGLMLVPERKGAFSSFWMNSIVLNKDFGISRDEMRRKMKEARIDTRPFFFPISMFPMYKEANTPVSHHIGLNGINLPSGLWLTEEIVDYITHNIRDILKV